MKARRIAALAASIGLLVALAAGVGLVLAEAHRLGAPVGTAFTYQGQLSDGGSPADGTYDFEFKLHDHSTSDSQVGSTLYVDDKEVTNGLFTLQLDFGSGVFTGDARYLEIGVRPGATTGAYTTLTPRQELTAAPYALHSLSTESLQGYPISDTVPTTGQLLRWNGSAWEPATVASGNQPPVAVLQADPAVLMPGETTTTLSLTLSYDPEGGPLTYAFDATGRTLGAPSSYSSTGVTTVDYTAPGDYLAAGWVRDAKGAFDVARALVSVYAFWNTIVDSAGDVGEYASLAVVEGRPAIAYYDDDPNWDLKYVRASDATGSSWGTPATVDFTVYVGLYASLAVVDGRPAIAYYEALYQDLEYVRAGDATGSSWGSPLTVYSAGDVGQYASLAVVDGRPAIGYFDATTKYLKYVRASDATGSTWGTPVTVDSAGIVGLHTSLALVDGRPAIAYFRSIPNYDLKYVRAGDAIGSSWGTPLTVDSAGDVGLYASLAEVEGRPTIAYYDNTNDDLKYVRAGDATGSSWGTPLTVDSAGDVGEYACLAVVAGRAAIAYRHDTNDDLRFAIARQD